VPSKRSICFVTGTRAEFGLMERTLRAIADHPSLRLQIIATGMHLDPSRGLSIDTIRNAGWTINATVPWKTPANGAENAALTGRAIAGLSSAFERLNPDVVLVVGDRVEAFAAATAAHLAGRIVAHVHGGDRALGQVDDALRHAITKLAHIHFPATRASAHRILKLGEDRWRIVRAGSPGVDGIRQAASSAKDVRAAFPGLIARRFALLVLHPTNGDPKQEARRAAMVMDATQAAGVDRIVTVYPNTDPGAEGIIKQWQRAEGSSKSNPVIFRRDVPRPIFLGLLRDATVLIGNSSSGIIEAASFGTPVVDIGPRQLGRERSGNVTTVPFEPAAIQRAVSRIWKAGRRSLAPNVYAAGSRGAGDRIAKTLASVPLDSTLHRKLIAY
jgi:UDP-hydrolysing UDP-N-acetyl-D-glucosamine 2-epimerase